ncbi:DUF2059 domain-containing protein [uncultured Sphingomonas sp.]|uniref:DUF2059 domain-containing protein n=1 Tax=uncultured Sphingomonas sp. TaxID=158754 RepID=UPI0035CA5373
MASALIHLPALALAPVQQGASNTVEPDALGTQLASLLQSRERVEKLDRAAIPPRFEANLRNQPDVVRLDRSHPGLISAMVNAGVDAVIHVTNDHLRANWIAKGQIYSASLSDDELRQAVTFYSSPVGQRFIEKYSSGPATRRLTATEDIPPSTVSELREFADVNSKSADTTMSAKDMAALADFMESSAGQKIQNIREKLLDRMSVEAQQLDRDAEPHVKMAMQAAATRFLASSGSPRKMTGTGRKR